MANNRIVSVRLSDLAYREMKQLAVDLHIAPSQLVRHALLTYLEFYRKAHKALDDEENRISTDV